MSETEREEQKGGQCCSELLLHLNLKEVRFIFPLKAQRKNNLQKERLSAGLLGIKPTAGRRGQLVSMRYKLISNHGNEWRETFYLLTCYVSMTHTHTHMMSSLCVVMGSAEEEDL